MSVEFYNKNAKEFYENTVNADMSDAYKEFEFFLKANTHILDLGCGSGRDSLYFLSKGYVVTSVDYSKEMVKKTTTLIGQEAIYLNMVNMNFQNEFHGIWACASILHIPKETIPKVLMNCYNALKKEGILYMSFKYGEGEVQRNGRHFSNFTEKSFRELLNKINLFKVEKYWITGDVRENRSDEKWLNVILKKSK